MANYAQIINGVVSFVAVFKDDDIDSLNHFQENTNGEWIQCSLNTRGGIHYDPITGEPDGGTPIRYNYPGPGYIYDKEADAFYTQQPYPSWTLNKATYLWEAPIPKPNEFATWDETNQIWNSPVIELEQPAPGYLFNKTTNTWYPGSPAIRDGK
jgi:hypothetical protein